MSRLAAATQACILAISEIFVSIQGEGDATGWPFTFVRLAGCPLRCAWCDTQYAYEPSFELDIEEAVGRVAGMWPRRVLVTGGEPLAQAATKSLVRQLLEKGLAVWIETSGAVDTLGVDSRAALVIDVKCPSSGMADHMCWANLERLRSHDQVKFVIADRDDFEYAAGVIDSRTLSEHCVTLLSPVHGVLDGARLAEWLIEASLDARLSLPLQTLLWGGARGC